MEEKRTERIGIFGGSFDPVHIGHLIVAQDAVEQLELDQLIFVPAAVSPLKQDRAPVDGRHRLEMLRLATADHLRFDVSDIELVRGGVSYTIDTIRQLKFEHPGAELFFIIGMDSMVDLHRWHCSKELLESCTVVPLARGGECPGKVAAESGLPSGWKEKLFSRLIRIHEIEVSASEIRMRIAEGLSIQTLVPPEVEMYIAEHNLYT
ncbi:nicotinate-nucleotide adenylyltransferase [Tichowtungia aerotolerans]|uniref:Probable nicotinate-nucleotide adenylyltransferase n=1 Tax=Tichowtungia aerotolerans TaxID=2697043 RepID=A0A6P1M5W5_9BACT|nr:nicotinate-nucleotide adenylyltransferase [Tichowtungia aerotolerans]QHI69980.1 nicotinate (nicotinamide) nucleotide adenylyltransferase [Tichowtungia aerotolerans]